MPCFTLSAPAARLAGLLGVAVVATLPLGIALAAQAAPTADGPVAAVFPPWWATGRVFAAAGQAGPVLRFGAARFVIVVQAADRARLRGLGAWLLLDPAVLGGCTPHPAPRPAHRLGPST